MKHRGQCGGILRPYAHMPICPSGKYGESVTGDLKIIADFFQCNGREHVVAIFMGELDRLARIETPRRNDNPEFAFARMLFQTNAGDGVVRRESIAAWTQFDAPRLS